MRLKAVIFDWGGVLVRTLDYSRRAAWERRLGLAPGAAEGLVFGAETGWDVQLGTVSDEEHWSWVQRRLRLNDADLAAFRRDFFACDRLDTDLMAHIARLRRHYTVGLLSNASSAARKVIGEKYAVLACFDSLTISAEEGVMKPGARIFEVALARAGALAEETVFVDDAAANIAAARRLGLQAVHFTDALSARQELARLTGVA